MDMPRVVNSYFDADRRNDTDALLEAFAVGAVVKDEGARHEGLAAIRDWWMAAKTATAYIAEPMEFTPDRDGTFVRARVSGDFTGSPVTLAYAFTIINDHIVTLEIKS